MFQFNTFAANEAEAAIVTLTLFILLLTAHLILTCQPIINRFKIMHFKCRLSHCICSVIKFWN
jgi:hypothetical protein